MATFPVSAVGSVFRVGEIYLYSDDSVNAHRFGEEGQDTCDPSVTHDARVVMYHECLDSTPDAEKKGARESLASSLFRFSSLLTPGERYDTLNLPIQSANAEIQKVRQLFPEKGSIPNMDIKNVLDIGAMALNLWVKNKPDLTQDEFNTSSTIRVHWNSLVSYAQTMKMSAIFSQNVAVDATLFLMLGDGETAPRSNLEIFESAAARCGNSIKVASCGALVPGCYIVPCSECTHCKLDVPHFRAVCFDPDAKNATGQSGSDVFQIFRKQGRLGLFTTQPIADFVAGVDIDKDEYDIASFGHDENIKLEKGYEFTIGPSNYQFPIGTQKVNLNWRQFLSIHELFDRIRHNIYHESPVTQTRGGHRMWETQVSTILSDFCNHAGGIQRLGALLQSGRRTSLSNINLFFFGEYLFEDCFRGTGGRFLPPCVVETLWADENKGKFKKLTPRTQEFKRALDFLYQVPGSDTESISSRSVSNKSVKSDKPLSHTEAVVEQERLISERSKTTKPENAPPERTVQPQYPAPFNRGRGRGANRGNFKPRGRGRGRGQPQHNDQRSVDQPDFQFQSPSGTRYPNSFAKSKRHVKRPN